jgi:signal transduction histidine kinase
MTSTSVHERDQRAMDALDDPRHMRGVLINLLVGIRMVQLLPWPVALSVDAHYRAMQNPLTLTAALLQTAWSVAYSLRSLRTRELPDWVVALDVLVASACVVLSGRGWAAGATASWANLAVYPVIGVVLSTAVAWWPLRSFFASILLAACYFIGVLPELSSGGITVASFVGNLLSLIGFNIVTGIVSSKLMKSASAAARARMIMALEREGSAALQARIEERKIQYRILHDTVLSTLNAISRGAECDSGLRERCAMEADLIRNVISHGAEFLSSLSVELALVAYHQAALGVRVHCQTSDLPEDLPAEVLAALVGACREALNNVVKHAGTGEAWLTALQNSDGTLVVTIADQGKGFSYPAKNSGIGIVNSIINRMKEAGGAGKVDSAVGEGTFVELRWPE